MILLILKLFIICCRSECCENWILIRIYQECIAHFLSVKAHGIRRECRTALLQFMLTWSKLSDDDGHDEDCFALLFADVMCLRE